MPKRKLNSESLSPGAAMNKIRNEKLSPERRREIAAIASKAAAIARKRIPKAKRQEIARNAGLASGEARRNKSKTSKQKGRAK